MITADLHYNHARSRAVADDLIDRINAAGGDVLLVVGDTAVADGDSLERCLSRFTFAGPKLFVAGNHELWTNSADSYALFTDTLPRRVRGLGWHWLQSRPMGCRRCRGRRQHWLVRLRLRPARTRHPDPVLRRKNLARCCPAFPSLARLFHREDDILPIADTIVARWNDGKFVNLDRSDGQFLQECLDQLQAQLSALSSVPTVIAAVHHVPFHELLPPPYSAQWDFVKAFLGSPRLGQLLLAHPNVRHVYCGHSHLAKSATIGDLSAVNTGSGYREKRVMTLDVG